MLQVYTAQPKPYKNFFSKERGDSVMRFGSWEKGKEREWKGRGDEMYLYFYDYYCWWCVGGRGSGGERYGGCRYVDWTNELLIPKSKGKKNRIYVIMYQQVVMRKQRNIFLRNLFFFFSSSRSFI